MPESSTGASASPDPLLVVILGPTASGKTSLSLDIAERFSGEIVNCDSVAIYREFDIGTAKPTASERARAPHHLFDFVSPNQAMTAGEYSRIARETLRDIKSRSRLPVVVGGTGFYLRALLDGLFAGPERSEELRERLRELSRRKGASHLHRILQRLDSASAARIHPHDAPKMIRAIEVYLAAKRPMSEMWQEGRDPLRGFRILRIGLDPDRAALYARIDERARQMFDLGLIDETRTLACKYPQSPVLNSLGYKQAAQLIRGELDWQAAISAAQQGHRNYAKRQMTWFRRELNVQWLRGFGDDAAIQLTARERVTSELSQR